MSELELACWTGYPELHCLATIRDTCIRLFQTVQPQAGHQMPKATCMIPGETSKRHSNLNSASIAIPENCAQINDDYFKPLIVGEWFVTQQQLLIHQHSLTSQERGQAEQASSVEYAKEIVLSLHSTSCVCFRYISSNVKLLGLSSTTIPALALHGFLP